MKNTYTTPADFWQVRDFGAKISAVFDFIGEHWRRLGKCLVYFVLPGALLLGIGLGLFFNTLYDQMGLARKVGASGPNTMGSASFTGFSLTGGVLMFVGLLLSALLLLSTVYAYLRARLRLPAAEPVTPAAVWAAMRERLGSMLLSIVVFLGGYFGLALGFGVVFGVAAVGFKSAAASIPILFLVGMAVFALATYVGVALSLYFPVLWLEDRSVFSTVGRCFQLIKGRWWATLGLLLVVALLQSTLSIVFILPQYAIMFGKMMQLPGLDSDVVGVLAQCFYAVGVIFVNCVSLLAAAFQYFSLTEEREGHGLRLLVNELGQPQATPTAYSHHYRPEEEQY